MHHGKVTQLKSYKYRLDIKLQADMTQHETNNVYIYVYAR